MKCSKCQFDNPDETNFCGKCGVPLAADVRMADSMTKTLAATLPVIAKDNLIAGKYRIVEEVGAGGMGVVYKAEDLKLKRAVALKFFPPHLMDSPELKERFLIEAQAAAALSHQNIGTMLGTTVVLPGRGIVQVVDKKVVGDRGLEPLTSTV